MLLNQKSSILKLLVTRYYFTMRFIVHRLLNEKLK